MRRVAALGTLLVLMVAMIAIAVPVAGQEVPVVENTCKDLAPFDTNEEASVSGAWGSITFDNTSSTLALVVNEGFTVQVCLKAGSINQGDGPENAGTFGEGNYSLTHSTLKDLSHFDFIVVELPTTTEASTTTTEGSTTTTTEGGTTTTTEGSTTTTEGSTTTTTEGGSTTTIEGGSTTTTEGGSTTTTLVGVNPICIDCNNATQADLMQLTGVNATLAQAIIDNRPYFTLQDLVTRGVMTGPQLFLIIAVNLNTGAFAGPECLNAAIGVTTTTIGVGETTTTTASTTTPGNLPFTGIDLLRYGAAGGSLLLVGLLIVLAMRRQTD